jgi:hypothetical protein
MTILTDQRIAKRRSTKKKVKPVVAKPIPTVTNVYADDWEGYFIDGKIVYQTHSVRTGSILEELEKLGLIKFETLEADEQSMQEFGSFPDTLEQARKDGIIQ